MTGTPAIQRAIARASRDYLKREAEAAREVQRRLKAEMYARKAAKEKQHAA